MALKSLANAAVRGEFLRVIKDAEPAEDLLQLAFFNRDSKQFSEIYTGVGDTPRFKKWVGQREINQLKDFTITITNEIYQAALEVYADEIEFDKLNIVQARVDALPSSYNDHYRDLLNTVIESAASTICYTGQFFFDTDHVVGDSGIFSNSMTFDLSDQETARGAAVGTFGTVTTPSPEAVAWAIIGAVERMMSFKSDTGRLLNQGAKAFGVMVPLSYMGLTANAIANAFLNVGRANPLDALGLSLTLMVNPRLTWTNRLAVFRLDGNQLNKPFILQEMGKLNYSEVVEGTETWFQYRKRMHGLDVKSGAGIGAPQGAVLITFQA